MKRLNVEKQRGFTLVEIAVVLVILAIIVGAGFSTLSAYIDNANQSHTMGNLKVTKRAMLDFVKVNKHMPCPDSDGDGYENRTGNLCTASTGTVPFNDIGLSQGVASDDYGNVFDYGINTDATTSNITNVDYSASYFSNVANTDGQFPAFQLSTPPTSAHPKPDSTAGSVFEKSYSVCKKGAGSCTATAGDHIEVQAIPAVIVAYNENGGTNELDGSPCSSWGTKEAENCDGDLLLWRDRFKESEYDDQIVTISGYEIKQQISFIDVDVSFNYDDDPYEGYDHIIRGDVDDANEFNVADGEDNRFYIDSNEELNEEGDLSANIVFKDGDDKLYVTGDIEHGGSPKMKDGDDYVYVGGNIEDGGVIYLGSNTETDLDDPDASTDGNDVAIIEGNVDDGALISGEKGNDSVTVNGTVAGSIDMGQDNDRLYLNNETTPVDGSTADIDGGQGTDYLFLNMAGGDDPDATWNGLSWKGSVSNFEKVIFNDNKEATP